MKFPEISFELPFVSRKSYEVQSEATKLHRSESEKWRKIALEAQSKVNELSDRSAKLSADLAESEDQRQRILVGYERMESDLNTVKVKYGMALKQIEKDECERARKAELALDIDQTEFSFLRNANAQLITELMALVDRAGKYVAAGSLKIRSVEGIAYRDGAFDGLKSFKAHIASFLLAKAKNA